MIRSAWHVVLIVFVVGIAGCHAERKETIRGGAATSPSNEVAKLESEVSANAGVVHPCEIVWRVERSTGHLLTVSKIFEGDQFESAITKQTGDDIYSLSLTFVKHEDGKDHYQMGIAYPGGSLEKEVTCSGEEVIVFDDHDQKVIFRPAT